MHLCKLNIDEAVAGDADGVWITAALHWQMHLFKDSPSGLNQTAPSCPPAVLHISSASLCGSVSPLLSSPCSPLQRSRV